MEQDLEVRDREQVEAEVEAEEAVSPERVRADFVFAPTAGKKFPTREWFPAPLCIVLNAEQVW